MRTEKRLTPLLLLLLGVGACDQTAPPDAPKLPVATAAPVTPTPPPAPATITADAGLAVAGARDAAARAAREQTLRVQQQLREQQREQRMREAASDGNERCVAGQRMRRVANGWVDAGTC